MKRIIPILVCIILAFILKSVITSTVTIYKNGNIVSQLQAQLVSRREEHSKLTEQLNEVKTSRYVEEQARNNLGLLKDGEVAVLSAQDQVLQAEKLLPPPIPNYQKWANLFF